MANTRTCRFDAMVDGMTVVFTQTFDDLAAMKLWNNKQGIENVIRMRYPSARHIENAHMCYE